MKHLNNNIPLQNLRSRGDNLPFVLEYKLKTYGCKDCFLLPLLDYGTVYRKNLKQSSSHIYVGLLIIMSESFLSF